MEISKVALEALAKESPYSVILCVGFYLFFYMYKTSLAEIRTFSEKTITEIRKAYKEAYKTNV